MPEVSRYRQIRDFYQNLATPQSEGGWIDAGANRTEPDSSIFGYKMREPYEPERSYFRENPNVSGMAAEDNRIVLNPYSQLTMSQKMAVAKNEAIRLWLRSLNVNPDFELTQSQRNTFKGTPYENDDLALKHSVVARYLTGDPSGGNYTPEQRRWAEQSIRR